MGSSYLNPNFLLGGELGASLAIGFAMTTGLTINTVGVRRSTETYLLANLAVPVDASGQTFHANIAALIAVYCCPWFARGGRRAVLYLADFYDSSTLPGIAYFEEPAITMPAVSGVAMQSTSTGKRIPIIPPLAARRTKSGRVAVVVNRSLRHEFFQYRTHFFRIARQRIRAIGVDLRKFAAAVAQFL